MFPGMSRHAVLTTDARMLTMSPFFSGARPVVQHAYTQCMRGAARAPCSACSRYAILPHPSAGPCIECANPGFAADAVLTRIRRRRVRVCLGALPRGVPADACMPAVRLSFFFFSRSVPARGAVPLDVGAGESAA